MLKLSHPIISINGFKIGDKVRLKDGDGRPHIIKSFSIDGMKEFFFEVWFEDGTETMLNNIAPLPSNLDEAAEEYAQEEMMDGLAERAFKAGAEWMAGQGQVVEGNIIKSDICHAVSFDSSFVERDEYEDGDKVIVQIRKK